MTIFSSRIVVSNPSFGISPSGFSRMHVEMRPKEVSRLVGYDPRSLVMKPPRTTGRPGRGTREIVPHNVSPAVIELQNSVQRSIDKSRVNTMVDYLLSAMEGGMFADWSSIELVTASPPEPAADGCSAVLDPDADYFIADGQHRYCALLDFIREYPQYNERFTQGITISVLPAERLTEFAGQKFHDHNYFSVAVRAGKALSVDTRDPVNALAKSLEQHPDVVKAGGVAYERDTLLAGDSRLWTHSTVHRFTRGFLFGRSGVDKGTDTRIEVDAAARSRLWEYVGLLAHHLPWRGEHRDAFLARTSVILTALAVVGHDLWAAELSEVDRRDRIALLGEMDWRRTNLALVGVVGSEKNGQVAPASSRQAIDSTIRYLREALRLLPKPALPGNGFPSS